jgi:hypothetical protein
MTVHSRRTAMSSTRRTLATTRTPLASGLAVLALLGVLAGCGSDPGADVATNVSDTSASSPSPSPTPNPTPTAPTEAPKPGSLPDFPYRDYAFTLGHTCFCANYDQRYRVTVTDGEVSSITYETEGPGHRVGDPVSDKYLRLTIQDIIDRGNDPDMARVRVKWPAGQLYPDSVYLDQMANVADEEVTWLISDVDPA